MPDCLLALETSSDRCGVALLRTHADGTTRLHLAAHDGAAEHSARILPLIDSVLAEAGVSREAIGAVAFGSGPGGFTGLRVACGVTQGIAFALDIPVVAVPSHAAVAWRLRDDPAPVRVIALDARMDEIYAAVYRQSGDDTVCLQAPVLITAAGLAPWVQAQAEAWGVQPDDDAGLCVAGDCAPALHRAGGLRPSWLRDAPLRPDAEAVAWLGLAAWRAGETVPAEAAQPLYVRDKVAFTTRERAEGAGGNPRAGSPV